MKFNKSQSAIVFSFLLACAIPATQALAQTTDVASAAKKACEESAVVKGFQVSEIVSVEPKGTDGANVVLSLMKEGQPYKLTCGYTLTGGASFAEDMTKSVQASIPNPTAAMNWGPLWWLLVPIIGLPLLLAWAKGRGVETVPATRSYGTGIVGTPYDAIVRSSGQTVNVYSGPSTSDRIIATLNDGQRISASGRKDGAWTQLASGGWVQSSKLWTDLA